MAEMTVNEAALKLNQAILDSLSGERDDKILPLRYFMSEIGKMMSMKNPDVSEIPEQMTVGHFRQMLYEAKADLEREIADERK